MPERWIDDVIPDQPPTEPFIARLREELADAWATGTAPSTFSANSKPAPRSSSRRSWYAAAAFVAVAAAITIAIVATRDADNQVITVPATDPTNPLTPTQPSTTSFTSTSSSSPTASTPPTVAPDRVSLPQTLDSISGHLWVRRPATERFPYTNEPILIFSPDGTVSGFDGCAGWSARVEIDGDRLGYVNGTAPPSTCASRQHAELDHTVLGIWQAGPIYLLGVNNQTGGDVTEYVDANSLPAASPAELIGAFRSRLGDRIVFRPDGRFEVGPCGPIGAWKLAGDTLTFSDVTATSNEVAACTGVIPGRTPPLVEVLDTARSAPTPVTVTADGPNLLLSTNGTNFWLLRGPDDEPAIDLRRGTLYGFSADIDIDAEFVIDHLTADLGDPTFDSGWYTTVKHDVADGEDCMGGRPMRLVQWNDITIAFLQNGEPPVQRLWRWSVGDLPGAAVAARLTTTLTRDGTASRITTSDGIGIGANFDQLHQAGYDLTSYFNPDRPVTDTPILATQANVDGYALVTVQLDTGTITAITAENPGFC